jgi:hypothetical protein
MSGDKLFGYLPSPTQQGTKHMVKGKARKARAEPLVPYDPQIKLSEAKYFLGRLRTLDRDPMLDHVGAEFDYNLSAFGSAARTVIAALPKATKGRVSDKTWRSGLTEDELRMWEGLVEFREAEVHDGRSDRETVDEQEPMLHHLIRHADEKSWYLTIPGVVDAGASITVRRRLSPARDPKIPAVEWCEQIVAMLERRLSELKDQGLLE